MAKYRRYCCVCGKRGAFQCAECRELSRRLDRLHRRARAVFGKPPDVERRIRKYRQRAEEQLPLFDG